MELNVFRESYAGLLDLGIIINVGYEGQKLKLIHVLTILMKFIIYLLLVISTLR